MGREEEKSIAEAEARRRPSIRQPRPVPGGGS
jgi:hypothetical protein